MFLSGYVGKFLESPPGTFSCFSGGWSLILTNFGQKKISQALQKNSGTYLFHNVSLIIP